MEKEKILSSLDFKTFYQSLLPSLRRENVKGEAIGLCPFHDDHVPSLSINIDSGLWHCFAGCGSGDVFDFYMRIKGTDFKTALEEIAEIASTGKESEKKIIKTYDYTDESGNLLFQVVRYDPKDFRQRRPDGNGGWIWNLEGVTLVPYNLTEVIKAKNVIVVEGEKDVETLRELGITATCNPMGAGKWKAEYAGYFWNKRVAIIPHNDEVGRKHAQEVAENLYGIVESDRIVNLPGLSEKGDVSDWRKEAGNEKERLIALIKETPEWKPSAEKKSCDGHQKKEKKSEENQSEKLLRLASTLQLFHDNNKEGFAFFNCECVSLRSKKIKQWLAKLLYETEGTAPNSDALNQAINVLEAKALFNNPQKTLFNRIAKVEDVFWYDLGNGKAIKLTGEGWEVTEAPILFRRYTHQSIQIMPVSGGDPHQVFNFLNIDEEHRLLILVYIISCFIPDIPHPIFHPHGPQGSGKTCLCKMIKMLCDPSSLESLSTPRDLNQLVQVIAHHHVCLFDNMSDLPPWMSDIMAQACTGGGFSKRQLYTDDDDVIYQVKRCIGLNGINLLISKPDLMDRSILLHLERIESARRIEERELWERFEENKPYILGGIFDILSRAISIYPSLKIKGFPRMADFTRWGCSITEALGKDGNEFLKAYQKNIEHQNEEVIQGNTLAQAVLTFMAEKGSWEGTIKQAWDELSEIANPTKENPTKTKTTTDPTFPKSDRTLRKHLERIKTNLLDKGIAFQIGVRGNKGIPIAFQKNKNFASSSTLFSSSNKIRQLSSEDNSEAKILSSQTSSQGNLLKFDDNETSEANEDDYPIFWDDARELESEV